MSYVKSLLIGVPVTLLSAVDGTGAGDTFALPSRSTVLTWQTAFDADPNAIDIDLEISIDGVDWTVLDTSTAVGGETRNIDVVNAGLFVRVIVNTNTGDKEVTVTIVAKVAVP